MRPIWRIGIAIAGRAAAWTGPRGPLHCRVPNQPGSPSLVDARPAFAQQRGRDRGGHDPDDHEQRHADAYVHDLGPHELRADEGERTASPRSR